MTDIPTENPKHRAGRAKPPLRLVPAALIIYASLAYEHGAAKYGAYNWRQNRISRAIYLEAAMRHLLAVLDGEDLDEESGVPHEAHVVACMGIILDGMAMGRLISDRPWPGPGAELLSRLTEERREV